MKWSTSFVFLLAIVGVTFGQEFDTKKWGSSIDLTNRTREFLRWLILGCNLNEKCVDSLKYKHVEYEGYDGFYNNFARPDEGAIDTPLLRILPPVYSDGVYKPVNRPANPIEVSEKLMKGKNGKSSFAGYTAFLLFFGQQVVEEVLDAQGAACPPEYFNIEIPKHHKYRTSSPYLKELPLLRTRYDMNTGYSPNNPRQQLNEITPYIDGGLIYGSSKAWADVLRLGKDGTIAKNGKLAKHSKLHADFPAENSHRLPMANPPPPSLHDKYVRDGQTENVDRFFKLGNPRGSENPFLLTFGILWYRWHNVIAEFLSEVYPDDFDGETIFNEARKWVIATQQAVTIYDWLPKYINDSLDQYNSNSKGGYDPAVNPQISHVFQSAAMRFGHTLVPSGVYLREKEETGCNVVKFKLDGASRAREGVRTCNSFWRSPEFFSKNEKNFERFIMGMSSQTTEASDNVIVEDLRGSVFGPLEFSRRDLMAINIQRGRDHGLPDYNTARKHFGLEPLLSLDPIEFRNKTNTLVNDQTLEMLEEIYKDVNNVDIWPGGLLETTNGPGQLFKAVIKDQFTRIRNGDRFWFENEKNGLFNKKEIQRIRAVNIIHLLLSVTNISLVDIQHNPFSAPTTDNRPSGERCRAKLNSTVSCRVYNTSSERFENTTCMYLQPLGDDDLEKCTEPQTYDFFSGSTLSFIFTFVAVGLFTLATIVGVNCWSLDIATKKKRKSTRDVMTSEGHLKCKERVSMFERRNVIISLEKDGKQILVKNMTAKVLRAIDLTSLHKIKIHKTENNRIILIRADNHYDLYLICEENLYAINFLKDLNNICQQMLGIMVEETVMKRVDIDRDIVTVKHRKRQLTKFMADILEQEQGRNIEMKSLSSIQLTKLELAEAMGLTADSLFLNQLFYVMDVDNNGFITVQEFASVILKFSKGTLEEKSQLLFQMYDLDHSGYITINEFKTLLESTMGNEAKQDDVGGIISSMLSMVGVDAEERIDFARFQKIIFSSDVAGNSIKFDMKNEVTRTQSRFSIYISPEEDQEAENPDIYSDLDGLEYEDINSEESTSKVKEIFDKFINYFKANELIIFWRTMYTLVMLLIFAERAYYFSVEREHAGLRRIAGYGVTVTRGAASAMMFTYSTLLVTMCRNILSVLRSSFLNRFYPFDDTVQMHKFIGWWALFFTVIHVIGHSINFYHISTQTPTDLLCIFRNFYRSTHDIPKFHYWCWETVTGLTGVFLTIQVVVIYIFAVNARHHLFRMFWITHNSYPLFYLLIIIHGSGQLVQPPYFHYFFLGPCILFIIDQIVSISRKSVEKLVWKAEHLPSNVTVLHIQRPLNFNYLSGQWVRIASLGISSKEFHPFTLSSAPHEKNLTLHIRGVGPWTNRLRKVYPEYESIKHDQDYRYPMIYIDGPFGEGHQNWFNYEVAVLVGGGIGVTPFASILKDIVYQCKQPTNNIKCKKVFFLWVTRSQKQFEWMTDILKAVEDADKKNLIRIHIFITQFKTKYDLRTLMLYHAERRFQKVHGRSMFTGLKAITHFSRPEFGKVFKEIKMRNTSIPMIGVFTCGNSSLSSAVDAGCLEANRGQGPIFKHYFENF